MSRPVFIQWLRHHATSVVTTLIDYGVLVACVELLHLDAVVATVLGAAIGAASNFVISRRFTYHAQRQPLSGQAWRFGMVAIISLALNGGGEYLFVKVLGVQYVLARVVTSLIVSNGWNYPMLRFFVFSTRREHEQVATRRSEG